MVAPVGKVVRVLVTGEDVIHSFSVPAFGIKIDAVPGRVNDTWFKADRTGTFYGQCSQLCGIDHAFMPIEVQGGQPARLRRLGGEQGRPSRPASAQRRRAPPPTAARAAQRRPRRRRLELSVRGE